MSPMQEETNQGRSLSSRITQDLTHNALQPRPMPAFTLLVHSFDALNEVLSFVEAECPE
jgi:hypothetical protein